MAPLSLSEGIDGVDPVEVEVETPGVWVGVTLTPPTASETPPDA